MHLSHTPKSLRRYAQKTEAKHLCVIASYVIIIIFWEEQARIIKNDFNKNETEQIVTIFIILLIILWILILLS